MAKEYQKLEKTRFTSVYKDTTSIFNGIWRLIIKWERSVYGLIWQELLIFITAYFALSFLYRYDLDGKLWQLCQTPSKAIPITNFIP